MMAVMLSNITSCSLIADKAGVRSACLAQLFTQQYSSSVWISLHCNATVNVSQYLSLLSSSPEFIPQTELTQVLQ